MKSPKARPLALVALVAALAAFFSAPATSAVLTRDTRVMGTTVSVTVNTDDPAAAERAFAAASDELERVESLMSEWREGTPLYRVNRNAGVRPVEVPQELYSVVEAALEVSRLTDGAFDVTWAAMWGLWDFTPGAAKVPDPADVLERIALVDYRGVVLDPEAGTVYLERPGMVMGLGGIAKGYAVDRAMAAVLSSGVGDVIVRAGGDMRLQGRGPDGPWPVGIKHPRKDGLLATLRLTDVSISTSGDYERYFISDGVRYHHIIDPATGYPARGARSVTILAPDTMTTDALATAVFVLGVDRGTALVEGLPGVEAIIVGPDGEVASTSGISTGGGRLQGAGRPGFSP